MFACILNTKAENSGSKGSIMPFEEFLAIGEVVICKKLSRKGSTPKFVSAEPKNTGVSSPCLTFSRSNS